MTARNDRCPGGVRSLARFVMATGVHPMFELPD
jgi:hypothetical protein